MNKPTLKSILTDLMSAEKLASEKKVYQTKTIESMRFDVVERAKQTLLALRTYEGGTFKAPMARSVRNGIAVKIGYGKKNECIVAFGNDLNGKPIVELRCNDLIHENRKEKAIKVFERVIPLLEDGKFDDELQTKLESFRSRAEKGKAKVRLVSKLDKAA